VAQDTVARAVRDAPVSGESLLKARGIEKHFGPVQALTSVDLDLPAGQITALCGDNGAGKSVLTKCVAGIYQIDHGQFFWEGQPVQIHGPRDASRLGIETVYQDLALADNLDIVQNMFLGRENVRNGFLNEDDMERAASKTLANLRVTTVRSIRQPVASLSGGQRQSIALARALAGKPPVLVFDEPTSAMDAQTETALLQRLDAEIGGRTAVMITHRPPLLQLVDRVMVVDGGKIVMNGPRDEVMKQITRPQPQPQRAA